MAVNPFLRPTTDARTSAMATPDLQNLRTPVSIGAQAIQRYLGNRQAPPNVQPQASPNGFGGTLGNGIDPNAASSATDGGNLAARNLQLQNPTGNDVIGTMGISQNPGMPNVAFNGGAGDMGPNTQTAAGGVVAPVGRGGPDWGSYFRQRMGVPTGPQAPRAPILMRQARVDNQGY